ncbi:MAG: hypothetical protein ACOC0N_09070 [Chroococcales cyanobacterium]
MTVKPSYGYPEQSSGEEVAPSVFPTLLLSSTPVSDFATTMTQSVVSTDPLNSPHPIPWNWILEINQLVTERGSTGLHYYRSPSLVSPDGQYAAYSRIQMQAESELFRSRVRSVMFLENLQTGELQMITASSPLASNPFKNEPEVKIPGAIAVVVPVSWSPNGDRILARQFEGLFNTSNASDYALIWNRQNNRTYTVSPRQVEYSNAILLGWSQTNPNQVLFQAGMLGDEEWPVWAVDSEGETILASGDQAVIYGRLVNTVWSGPQARYSPSN